MKKLTALILSALTAFAATALCACGDGKSAGENDGKNNAVTPATVLKPGDDGYTPAVPDEITLTEIPEDKMAETFDNFCDKVYRYNNGAVKSENLNATIDYICEYYDNYDFVIFPNFATEESCQKTVELYNFQLLNEDGKNYGKLHLLSKNNYRQEKEAEFTTLLYDNTAKCVQKNLNGEETGILSKNNINFDGSNYDNCVYKILTANTRHIYFNLPNFAKSINNYILHKNSDAQEIDILFDYEYGGDYLKKVTETGALTMKADKTRFYLEYDFVCLYEDKILYEDKAKLYIDLSSDLKKDEFKDIDATEEEKTNIVCYDIDDKQKFKEDFKANKTIELKPFVGNNVIGDLNDFLKKRKDMIVITCMYDGNPIEFIGSGIFSQEIDTQIFTKILANGNIILKANAYSDMSNIIKTVIKDFDEAKFGVQIILYGYDVKNYTNNPNITEYIYI